MEPLVIDACKTDVLRSLEPVVQQLVDVHREKRQLWFPSELLEPPAGEDPDDFLAQLRERAAAIDGPARVILVLAMLTEEGLPHFHRLFAAHMGEGGVWETWRNLWTAEEERHGIVLQHWVRDSRAFHPAAIERILYTYLTNGFEPAWSGDPYQMLAYTSMQERATQVTHASTGRLVGEVEPVVGGILKRIAMEEARHFAFYRAVFREVLERDPNAAVQSVAAVMTTMSMPGVAMPRFDEFADVARRAGIYGPAEYLAIVEEHIAYWQIASLAGLDGDGRRAQATILELPARLRRVLEFGESRRRPRAFSLADVCRVDFAMA